MSWDDGLNELKMEETPTVFLASLIGDNKLLDKDTKMYLAECLLVTSDYELDFLYSFTAHLADLLGDIEQITREAENPLEFTVSELLERTLDNMGVKGL